MTRFSGEVKGEVLSLVRVTKERTGWGLSRILRHLGITRSRYHDWLNRSLVRRLDDRASISPASVVMPVVMPETTILAEEKRAVIDYALSHPKDGYRRLAWQMIDEDVACLSPSSVYRVLNAADLLYRWKRSRSSPGSVPSAPTRPNERWHTDIMYLRIENAWYFLVTVIDAYSRYIVHSELLNSMTAADVRLVIQEALERTGRDFPGARPSIVSDNGTQFTSKDFKQLVREFELKHIRIRTYHPESNGVIERFHRSTREELSEQDLGDLGKAREIIRRWVEHYNNRRLHAGLGYLTPMEYYSGDPEARRSERRVKLSLAREARISMNRERLNERARTAA